MKITCTQKEQMEMLHLLACVHGCLCDPDKRQNDPDCQRCRVMNIDWEIEQTVTMQEVATDIVCSGCGVAMNDEIMEMFRNRRKDFKRCPSCGKLIVWGDGE